MNTKQVIVMRTDLNMRKGKMIAQGAHASMGVITKGLKYGYLSYCIDGHFCCLDFKDISEDPVYHWFSTSFKKITLQGESEKHILKLKYLADELNVPSCLITDSGLTEFRGVPTITCIAIGPWHSDVIDKITGDLKLL